MLTKFHDTKVIRVLYTGTENSPSETSSKLGKKNRTRATLILLWGKIHTQLILSSNHNHPKLERFALVSNSSGYIIKVFIIVAMYIFSAYQRKKMSIHIYWHRQNKPVYLGWWLLEEGSNFNLFQLDKRNWSRGRYYYLQ